MNVRADFAEVKVDSLSPFVIVAPLKAEYAEVLNAAFASIENADDEVNDGAETSDVGDNPITSGSDSCAFILLTGICAASLALLSKKKH